MSDKISNKSRWKKSLYILPALLILAVIFLPIIDKNFKGTIRPELKDFAIEKPEEVDKIFMVSKHNEKSFVTLEKNKEGKWMVNGEYPASEEKVHMLIFEYMARLKMKNPIPQQGLDKVMTSMTANATKVEIYKSGKLDKVYYVGGNAADEMGTHMFIEGSSVPFVVHIPGFEGYVSSVYNVNGRAWRSTNIFHTDILNLTFVEVKYPGEEQASFRIDKNDRSLDIKPLASNVTAPGKPDEMFLKQYAATFENLSYEGFFEDNSFVFADSVIRHSKPFVTVRLGNKNGKETKLDIYYKPVTRETKSQFDENGKAIPYDQDRFYGVINDSKTEIVSVQSFVFKNIFRRYKDFFSAV